MKQNSKVTSKKNYISKCGMAAKTENQERNRKVTYMDCWKYLQIQDQADQQVPQVPRQIPDILTLLLNIFKKSI